MYHTNASVTTNSYLHRLDAELSPPASASALARTDTVDQSHGHERHVPVLCGRPRGKRPLLQFRCVVASEARVRLPDLEIDKCAILMSACSIVWTSILEGTTISSSPHPTSHCVGLYRQARCLAVGRHCIQSVEVKSSR